MERLKLPSLFHPEVRMVFNLLYQRRKKKSEDTNAGARSFKTSKETTGKSGLFALMD